WLMKDYSTLSTNGQHDMMYHDRDSLPFSASYPIVEFLNEPIPANANSKILEKYLVNNFWYQKANSERRKHILSRTAHVNKHIDVVLDFIKEAYGHLEKKCTHISIAGSYIYADAPGDIDLNVVVEGS